MGASVIGFTPGTGMLEKKVYANGQAVYALEGTTLTYFFKNGVVKAQGAYRNDLMEGERKFYRETGQLRQVGNFNHGLKEGPWIRYDKNGEVEYEEMFRGNKRVK